MKPIWRTLLAIAAVFTIWVFWFVPNSLFWFENYHDLAVQMAGTMVFGVIPATLGVVLAILVASGLRHAIAAMVTVPVLSCVTCLSLWTSGYYSAEGLLGAWLNSLPPIPAYMAGVALGVWLRMSINSRAESDARAHLTRTR
jgi:hypothetical protein